jgi:hypothetical protein
MLDNTSATTFVNINGTLKKVSMISLRINLSIRKNIITVNSYNANLLIIADNLLDVIFSPSFLAFHIPATVSKIISTPIISSIPDIGIKNARHIDISVNSCDWTDIINKDSCVLILVLP